MQQSTNPATGGANQGDAHGTVPSEESSVVREYFELRDALQFQVHKLAEDVKVLELNLAGARGETKSGDIRAKRLRDEVQALQDEVQQLRKERGESSSSSGGEG